MYHSLHPLVHPRMWILCPLCLSLSLGLLFFHRPRRSIRRRRERGRETIIHQPHLLINHHTEGKHTVVNSIHKIILAGDSTTAHTVDGASCMVVMREAATRYFRWLKALYVNQDKGRCDHRIYPNPNIIVSTTTGVNLLLIPSLFHPPPPTDLLFR